METLSNLFELQFLRPYWLLGLFPVAILLWKIRQIKRKQGAWNQVIAPQFRHLLLGEAQGETKTNHNNTRHTLPLLGLSFIWLLAVIALAGPSTQSVEMPAQKDQQGSVILLDLSLSMLADDLTPNRLERVKYKITDLLTQHPELSIGLVGYAGSAHTISPISEDNQTLLSLLPALNPVLMPQFGSNPLLGFKQTKTLLDGAHIQHGHIIWITDDLETEQIPPLKQWIKSHNYSISILSVGTQMGGAVHIPNHGLLKDNNDNIILPPLPQQRFNAFANLNNVTLSHLTLSDQSLSALLPPTLNTLKSKETEQTDKKHLVLPLDQGIFLLLLLVPLVALLFRRGWILNLSFISLPLVGLLSASVLSVGLFSPSYSYANNDAETETKDTPSFLEAFKSPDQQAYQAWQKNNFKTAESLFENEQWRASTLYQLEKYPESAELFRKDSSANGQYNLGNALAKQGLLEEAKTAYESALKQQPDFAKSQKNLEVINSLLAQQEEKKQEQQDQKNPSEPSKSEESSEKGDDKDSEQSSDQNNDQKQEGSDSESDNRSKKESKEGKEGNESSDLKNEAVPQADPDKGGEENKPSEDESENKDENDAVQDSESSPKHQTQDERNTAKLSEQNKTDASENPEKVQLTAQEKEQQQATQNWLNQIPDDPGLFLKRKFEYQYQQSNPSNANQGGKQW